MIKRFCQGRQVRMLPNRDARSCDNLNGYYAKVSLPKLKSSHISGVPVPSQFQDHASAGFGPFAGPIGASSGLYHSPNPNYPFLRHHHQQHQLPPAVVHYLGTPPVNPR